MRLLLRAGLPGLAWSLRRLHCPVSRNDLVLEVGSGGNPFPRANVLCDAYEETQERHFAPLIADRPTVLSFGEKLPFKDNAFDFVIACHVLEHSDEPELFLTELQRVARAGYIEVPDAFMERLTCYKDHRLEITERDGELRIRKKRGFVQDPEIYELYTHRAAAVFPELVAKHPFDFHVRYFFDKDTAPLQYRIENPEYQIDWEPQALEAVVPAVAKQLPGARIKNRILQLAREHLSQSGRNDRLDLASLLRCPECASEHMTESKDRVYCTVCSGSWERHGYVIDFIKNP